MVLPIEELVKKIIQYGLLTSQGWKREWENVPESKAGEISECVKYWIENKPNHKLNGAAILGFCRIHEKNVLISFEMAFKLKAMDEALQRIVAYTSIPLLNFNIPELEDVDVQECLKRGLKYTANHADITMPDFCHSEKSGLNQIQEELVTTFDILPQLEAFLKKESLELLRNQTIDPKLAVDTSSEQGTSTSSPVGFPNQNGLLISPLMCRSSMEEMSTIGASRGDSADYDFDPAPLPVEAHPETTQTDDHLGQEHLHDDMEGEHMDDDFDLPPLTHVDFAAPDSPLIGPPIATSTPVKKTPGRACKSKEARDIYLKNDDFEAAPSTKKPRRQKRVTPMKKTKTPKRARLVNDSGISIDQDQSDDKNEEDQQDSEVFSNRMSTEAHHEFPLDFEQRPPFSSQNSPQVFNQVDDKIDEVAVNFHYGDNDIYRSPGSTRHNSPRYVEYDEMAEDFDHERAPRFSPMEIPRTANQLQVDDQIDEMADDAYHSLTMENNVAYQSHRFSPANRPRLANEIDADVDMADDAYDQLHWAPCFPLAGNPRTSNRVDENINEMTGETFSKVPSPKLALHDSGLMESARYGIDTVLSNEVEEKLHEQNAETLANTFEGLLSQTNAKVPFSAMLNATNSNKSSKDAARSFYTLLEMAKNQQIDVSQSEPYGEIELNKKRSVPGGYQ